MVEYDFILCTKYSFYLYIHNKNYSTKLPKPKSYLSPQFKSKKEKKKNAHWGFDFLVVVGGHYDEGSGPSDFFLSLTNTLSIPGLLFW